MNPEQRCAGAVADEEKRARICGKFATVERIVLGVSLPYCDACAAALAARGLASIPVDFDSPASIRAWLARIETVADDGMGAGEDQMMPLSVRDLGRRQAKVIMADAREALAELIAIARASLPPVK